MIQEPGRIDPEDDIAALLAQPMPADAKPSAEHRDRLHAMFDKRLSSPKRPRWRFLQYLSAAAILLTVVGLFVFPTSKYTRNFAADTPAPDWVHWKMPYQPGGVMTDVWMCPSLKIVTFAIPSDPFWFIADIGNSQEWCFKAGYGVHRWPIDYPQNHYSDELEIARALYIENAPLPPSESWEVQSDNSREVDIDGKRRVERTVSGKTPSGPRTMTLLIDPITRRANSVKINESGFVIDQTPDYPAAGPADMTAFGLDKDTPVTIGRLPPPFSTTVRDWYLNASRQVRNWWRQPTPAIPVPTPAPTSQAPIPAVPESESPE